MTLRNRVATAAAVGVLLVVAAVSTVLYFSYAASVRARADAALVDAAQQVSTVAQKFKQAASTGGTVSASSKPISVGWWPMRRTSCARP